MDSYITTRPSKATNVKGLDNDMVSAGDSQCERARGIANVRGRSMLKATDGQSVKDTRAKQCQQRQ